MVRIISFALGCIWRWSDNRNVLLNYAKNLDISGVEITFASKEELYSFNISAENQAWLNSLDYVTIHAPFYLIRDSESTEEITRQLETISKLCDDIDVKNVIIHPDELPAPEVLKEYGFNILTENLPPESHISIADLKKILDRYPDIGVCVDVSHAYLWSEYETNKLLRAFKGRVAQIHFSGTYGNKDHQSLRNVTEKFIFSIKPIEKSDIPIVIEEDIHVTDFNYVIEEVEYIKNILIN